MILAREREGVKQIENFSSFQSGAFNPKQRQRYADIANLIKPEPHGCSVARLLRSGGRLQIVDCFLRIGQVGFGQILLPVDIAIDEALFAGCGTRVCRQ